MSDKTDSQDLMDIFFEETQSLIDKMKKELSILGGAKVQPVFFQLFRCVHNIKSSSGAVGFDSLRDIAHALEKIFKVEKEKKSKINTDVIALFSEGVEACQRLLNEEEVVGYKELLERLNKYYLFLRSE
jgi:two-component system chemotaxis sensor kinase CheA